MTFLPIGYPEPDPVRMHNILTSRPQKGGGLNQWLFKAAKFFTSHGSPENAVELLAKLTSADQVPRAEISRTVRNACGWAPSEPNAPRWPIVNEIARQAILRGEPFSVTELKACSPAIGERLTAGEIVGSLFPGDPLLCCGASNAVFATAKWSEWQLDNELPRLSLIVPSAMSAKEGLTKEGRVSAHTLANTGPRHYLVIEQDEGTLDEQAAILTHLARKAPLVLAVHSGGKSIHGWFQALGYSEEQLKEFMRYAVSLGADRATWTRSQFVRMPGGTRENGKRQEILHFNQSKLRKN
jgi:hypothetical protein